MRPYLTDVDIVDDLHSSAVGAGRGLQRHLPCKKKETINTLTDSQICEKRQTQLAKVLLAPS